MSTLPYFIPPRPVTRSFAAKRRLQLTESPGCAKRPLKSAKHMAREPSELVKDLKSRLEGVADASKKPFMERYLRNELPCRGVQIPIVEKTVNAWSRENGLGSQIRNAPNAPNAPNATLDEQLLRSLFESPFSEDKIAATVYAGLVARFSPTHNRGLISLFEELFEDDLIRPWSTTDSFCNRVLAKMIKRHDDEYSNRISSWSTAENLWKARCSIVTFVPFAKDENFRERIWKNSTVVVQRPERFAKTSIGWILRQVARYDEKFMMRFVEQFKKHMSLEAVRNATKHCNSDTKKKYVEMVKESKRISHGLQTFK